MCVDIRGISFDGTSFGANGQGHLDSSLEKLSVLRYSIAGEWTVAIAEGSI